MPELCPFGGVAEAPSFSLEDPSFSVEDAEVNFPSIRNFEPIKAKTHCIYSAGSRIWGSPPLDRTLSFRENMRRVAGHMAHFINLSRAMKIDGYVIDLPDREYGDSVEALARSTHAVLRCLSDFDPMGEGCMDKAIEDPAWCFTFGGERIFVNTFAPCYPESHARYGFGSQSTIIAMQPRHTFAPMVRPGDSSLGPAIRQRIRTIFNEHGRSYAGNLSMVPYEAYRCIRPMQPDGPVVRWWETPLDGI